MKDEFETEIRTRKSNGPTIRGRAATYVKETFNPVTLAFAYREGYRVFTALESLQRDFDITAEFEIWRYGDNDYDQRGLSEVAMKAAFYAGSQDAKDRSTKTQHDPEPDMFEESTQTPTAARTWGPDPPDDILLIEE